MVTAYLHVGMHKTGSSAFQNWCFRNRDALRTAGLAYPRLPFPNHSYFLQAQFIVEEARALAVVGGVQRVLVDERASLREAFAKDLAANAAQGLDVIISGENASHLAPAECEALVEFLRGLFGRVVVLGLVRAPVAFAGSMAQQALRGGRRLEEFVDAPVLPRYRDRFGHYFACADEVRLHAFRRDSLRDGCVLQTLLAMMDGDRSALADARAPRVNESASATAATLLSLINRSLVEGRLADELPEVVRRPLSEGFCGEFVAAAIRGDSPKNRLPSPMLRAILGMPGPRFVLPRELAVPVEKRCAEDAAWVSAILGEDIRDGDTPTHDLPPLSEVMRLSPADAEAVATTLSEVNEAMQHSWAETEAAEADARRRKADAYARNPAGVVRRRAAAPKAPAKARPKAAPKKAPLGPIAAALRRVRSLGRLTRGKRL